MSLRGDALGETAATGEASGEGSGGGVAMANCCREDRGWEGQPASGASALWGTEAPRGLFAVGDRAGALDALRSAARRSGPDAELRDAAADFVVAFWRRRFLLRPKGSLLELEECRRRFAAKKSAYGAWLGVEALSVEL